VLAFQVGEAFIVALAARVAIPARLHEAIEVEGGSAWFAMTRDDAVDRSQRNCSPHGAP